jgi:hypothetical protein
MRRSTPHHWKLALHVAAALAAAPLTVHAEEGPDPLTDSFGASLAGFILNSDVTVRVDGDTGLGTPVDLSRTFGKGDATRFRLDGRWRFGERHKLRGAYFSNDWSNSRTIDDEIEWGGDVYPVGAKVKAEFNIDIYQVTYEYSFLKRDNYEVSAGIGLHYTGVSAGLSARITGEGGTVDGALKGDNSVDLPLPVISLGGLWRLPQNFWVRGQAQLFALQIGDYDGTLQDLTVAVTWQPKPWLGLGLAYNYFAVDVDVDKDRFKGNLDWVYDGPMIFYSASF